jgi:hypothetical protein
MSLTSRKVCVHSPFFGRGRFLSGEDYQRFFRFRHEITPEMICCAPGFQGFSFTVVRCVNVMGSQTGESCSIWAISPLGLEHATSAARRDRGMGWESIGILRKNLDSIFASTRMHTVWYCSVLCKRVGDSGCRVRCRPGRKSQRRELGPRCLLCRHC